MILALIFGLTLHSLLPGVAPTANGTVFTMSQEAQAVDRRHVLRIIGGAALALVGGAGFWYGGTVLNQGGFTSPVDRLAADDNTGAAQADPTATSARVSQANPTATSEPQPTDTAAQPTNTTAQPTNTT